MSRRRLGWMTLMFWFGAAISLDRLRDLPGLMTRHHAGLLAPFGEYAGFGGSLAMAIFFTVRWYRANKMQSIEKTGQVNVS